MRILVTNDDGIHEPGLRALVVGLRAHGYDVVVAGPPGQCSGSGASLGTVEHEALIGVTPATVAGLEEVTALAVEGPPALAVRRRAAAPSGRCPTSSSRASTRGSTPAGSCCTRGRWGLR